MKTNLSRRRKPTYSDAKSREEKARHRENLNGLPLKIQMRFRKEMSRCFSKLLNPLTGLSVYRKGYRKLPVTADLHVRALMFSCGRGSRVDSKYLHCDDRSNKMS
ncbi:UNVERIFIED_CONTAM: hypothetical protein NCL1_17042 [Trichonephila clavipes]